MLDKHLLVVTRPKANEKNVLLWGNYRITVLQDRLFRLEYSRNKKFRDEATQSVWYRNMPAQIFSTEEKDGKLYVKTLACVLVVAAQRKDCRIILGGKEIKIDNTQNLMGTYRTLDEHNGKYYTSNEEKRKIVLGTGVCSRKGVAVFNDADSLTLGKDGALLPVRGDGTDEYIFAYGNDYRGAVRALYKITGEVPMIPRFALGNWWSRYHVYTDKEYLRVLNSFEEQEVPLTVATIDMDWHYSDSAEIDRMFSVSESGKNTMEYVGSSNMAWTGYTWNKRLFPDYKGFLHKIKEKNLKITLNLHPADGIRFWEEQYEDMAKAMEMKPSEQKHIAFDIANDTFVNAYFKILHKPYEQDGVAFWWIDWQQGTNSKMEGLDPLWALNHYHYLDNAVNHSSPLILSRYCGIGSHRYPLGFSGDTFITWDTLHWLPEFTATASNIGYTWWSHDIGGHFRGEKNDEMYLRHIQFGVFSPINRLHCGCEAVQTKEPWAYGNGAGELIKKWMRFRHSLIPYLYSAAYRTHRDGLALVEPLYYEWDDNLAYQYKNEYLFGGELLVIPVTQKAKRDGFAHIKAWLPQGKWTDIFTGAKYDIPVGGKELVMFREMESIPVLIKEGSILPLSVQKDNSVFNPLIMEIDVYAGSNKFILYEDGAEKNVDGELFTHFETRSCQDGSFIKQMLEITTEGKWTVVGKKRKFLIRFKDIEDGEISVFVDNKEIDCPEVLTGCVAIDLDIEANKKYTVSVVYKAKTQMERVFDYALKVLICGRDETLKKGALWMEIIKATTIEEYIQIIDKTTLVNSSIKERLKEII